VTVCVRKLVPEPQVWLQDDHFDHTPAQCTGHATLLQGRSSLSAGQVLPPHATAVDTWRAYVAEPTPHVFEHADGAPQSLTSQSTGQHWALHARVAVTGPQATPPCAVAVSVWRVRVVEPVPHVLVQEDQADHADWSQSTAHGWMLQLSVSLRRGQT